MQRLESMLANVELPRQNIQQYNLEQSVNSYDCRHNGSAYECITCQGISQIGTELFPTSTGFGIGYKGLLPDNDYHETHKVDRYDNLYGSHGTIIGTLGKHKRIIDFDE